VENVRLNSALSQLCTAVVFCGGRATRLRDQLRGGSKALVLLDSRPYLHSLLLRIREAGLKEVVLCVSAFTADISELVRSGSEYGLNVRYSFDSGLLENADALWQARSQIRTPLAICVNGDTIFDVNFSDLIRTHCRSEAVGTLVASERLDQPHPGGVSVAANGKVVDLHEWAQDRKVSFSIPESAKAYSNSGIYVLDMQRLLEDWSREDRIGKIEQGLLRSLAAKNKLGALKNGDRYLLDIGTPERLMTARTQLPSIARVFPV
jgi:NDP-sugar pyrophosphorylase family protein